MSNFKASNYLENISGDKKINFFKKIYWILICVLNYVISLVDKKDPRIELIKFRKNIKSNLIKKNESPSRILSDIFWLTFPWNKTKKILKKKISIIEVGCGDGRYGFLLKKILKKNFKNYTGIDIKKKQTWETKNKEILFKKSDCYKIGKFLKNKDLIITQSALEHFKYDLKFFENIQKKIINKKKFIQIHLIPSYTSLFTYLCHGYRHYNINTISKITKIFKKNCQIKLFTLGSLKLNLFHFTNITLSKNDYLKQKNTNSDYYKKLSSMIKENAKSKNRLFPNFYALVIFHNFKEKITNS